MQKVAFIKLTKVERTGAEKGLVISATGTGKTYLSAFRVLQAKPEKKYYFIVHREQILIKQKVDYSKILGVDRMKTLESCQGNKKEVNAKYLFATGQTIFQKSLLLKQVFLKIILIIILIDEVHEAGAQSYHHVIDLLST